MIWLWVALAVVVLFFGTEVGRLDRALCALRREVGRMRLEREGAIVCGVTEPVSDSRPYGRF